MLSSPDNINKTTIRFNLIRQEHNYIILFDKAFNTFFFTQHHFLKYKQINYISFHIAEKKFKTRTSWNLCQILITISEPHDHCIPSYLWDAIRVRDNFDNVIQWQQGVAFDLCIDILALGAKGQQLDQVDVVVQGTLLIHPVPLRLHQLNQVLKAGRFIVENKNIFTNIDQLIKKKENFV